MSLELTLTCQLESAAIARGALDGLAGAVPDDQLGDLRLLVSELVTNAIRHAELGDRDAIRLAVDVGPAAIRVEVHDPGRGFDVGEAPSDPDRASGWGLFLVETLADRWGVVRESGTQVWFELDLLDARAA